MRADGSLETFVETVAYLWFSFTLAVQQRHWRPGLEAPQGLHAAALLQVQQLDQDDRVELQEAAAARPDGASTPAGATSSSRAAM